MGGAGEMLFEAFLIILKQYKYVEKSFYCNDDQYYYACLQFQLL